jgi:hypothetical protein
MTTIAPVEITDEIRQFAREKIGSTAEPQFITITPELGCKAGDCFMNVQNKVIREGGRIQFGWAIWEWPGALLEAEHHAVYASPENAQFIDPTPCERGSRRRLFVPMIQQRTTSRTKEFCATTFASRWLTIL